MLDKLKAYFTSDAFKNLASRAAWTAVYVLAGTTVAVLTSNDADLSGAAIRAALIAAALAAGKAILVGRYGDPDKIRTRLGEIVNRVAHTAWQAVLASGIALFSTGQLNDFNAVKATLVAALVNVLKTVVIPPAVPGLDEGDVNEDGDQDGPPVVDEAEVGDPEPGEVPVEDIPDPPVVDEADLYVPEDGAEA